jgi:hypothetical protein
MRMTITTPWPNEVTLLTTFICTCAFSSSERALISSPGEVMAGDLVVSLTVVVWPRNVCGFQEAGIVLADRRFSSTANTSPHFTCTASRSQGQL